MVKIPTYKSETRPIARPTRNRPFLTSNPGQVGNAVSNFANSAADLAITVYEKNKRISDDRLQTQVMNDFTVDITDLNNKYKTSSDVENGAREYKAEADKIIQKYYASIQDNKHVSEWFFNTANTQVRGYYPSIENSIYKNNLTKVSEDLTDSKFLMMNTWLNADADGNRIIKSQQEDNMFGSENVLGIYDKLVRKGVKPELDKQQFNDNLKAELSVLHANKLIAENLEKFYELYEDGAYNSLDPEVVQQLKSSADGQNSKNQTKALAALNSTASELKEEIKDVIDINKDDYMPSISKVNDLLEKAESVSAALIANGKEGLFDEIQDLNNSIEVFKYIDPFKRASLSDIQAEYNQVRAFNYKSSGTDDFNSLNVSKEKALKKLIDFRKKNEDKNLLSVANSVGLNVQPIDFTDIDRSDPEDMTLLYDRAATAVATADLYNKPIPQFFLETERSQISEILATGSEDQIKNLIVDVSQMSGQYGYAAFQQLSDIEGADGIAMIGTLYSTTGPATHIDSAIKAFVLRNDKNTQDILNQYKSTKFEYSNIKTDAFSVFQTSPLLDDRKTYNMLNEAADLIYQGLLLSDPATATKFDSGLEPTKKAIEHMENAVQYAAGYFNGYGGLEEYNGHQLIVPGIYQGQTYHLNAEKIGGFFNTAQTLEEMLDNNMTDELLAKSVSSMPYFESEFTTDGPREARAEDLFNQNMVHLIPYDFGRYTFAFGDSPQTAIHEVVDKQGNLVIFDLAKIYKELSGL